MIKSIFQFSSAVKAFALVPMVGIALTLGASSAQATDYNSAEFKSAYQDYLQVANEEGISAKKLAAKWEAIYLTDETDPLSMVLLGSSHAFMGRDALMPWSKLNHTEKGLDELTLAQRLLKPEHQAMMFERMPVYLHVKTLAGITFTQVPVFFGRHEEGYYLFEDVLADTVFKHMPGDAQTYVYYYAISAAFSLDKSQQAKDWQQELKALNVQDEYSRLASELRGDL
jgi:hypothetical protein